MKLSTLLEKLTTYAITVLAPRAHSWAAKFMLGAGAVRMNKKAEEFIRATGLVDADDNVDLTTLHTIVSTGFKTAGHVDLFGGIVGFDPEDAEQFFEWVNA